MDFTDDTVFDKIFNFGFAGATIIIVIAGMVIAGVFISAFVNFRKNNKSPRLTVMATVISKRTDITGHRYAHDADYHSNINTWYYVAFQVDSGDRMEFLVGEYEYGLLIEGDVGKLTFQGSRFLSFERS